LASEKRRVLVVVSAFRPAMLADMHRARMLGWELPRLGWNMEVLAPEAAEVRADALERDAEAFFPPELPVHEFGSLARGLFALAGSGSLAWRTLVPAYRKGARLLASGRFDLVFLSTTTFTYFMLGALWSRRFGVPYVLDFHDPWVRRGSSALQRLMERTALGSAAGLIAVSPHYLETLRARYASAQPAWMRPERQAVIPFGAREADLQEARQSARTGAAAPADAISLAYVGAGGRIMLRSFTLICRALAALRAGGHAAAGRVRIHLYGTMYGWREGDAKPLAEAAAKAGVGDAVSEAPQRVSYRESLEIMLRADGLLVLGVDDAAYMPSKLVGYALSGKPLLASLRQGSPALGHFGAANGFGRALWFDEAREMPLADAASIVGAFIDEARAQQSFERRATLAPWLAPAMARRHAELFQACLAGGAR
jgi:hypothetical protein